MELLIELALECENDSHMQKHFRKYLGRTSHGDKNDHRSQNTSSQRGNTKKGGTVTTMHRGSSKW